MEHLHLLIKRESIADDRTLGSLYYRLNNSRKWTKICDTIELIDRGIDESRNLASMKYYYKIGSALPYGLFPLKRSLRNEGMIHVTPVPGFHSCYIADKLELKSGCVLLVNNPLNLIRRFKDFKLIDLLIVKGYGIISERC